MSKLKRLLRFLTASDRMDVESPMPAGELYRLQTGNSALSKQFCFILALSTVIATLGLMGDAPAIVIGAMLIAPMMKPIVALAYSLVISDRTLGTRAISTLAIGILLTVFISAGVESIFQLKGETHQILGRVQPTLLDLGVAVAAGTAAALAIVRKNVADSLPGVAIAVALVPPLCVVGIGISLLNWPMALGALFLFSVNLIAIVFCACLIFLLERYGSWRRSSKAFAILALSLVGMSVPLSWALKELTYDDRAQEIVESYLTQQYRINREVQPSDLSRVRARTYDDHIYVFAEIRSSTNSITPREVLKIKNLLEQEFDEPINLKLQINVTQDFFEYSVLQEDGSFPLYDDFYVPRR